MAGFAIEFLTDIPLNLVEEIEKTVQEFDLHESMVNKPTGQKNPEVMTEARRSRSAFIPTDKWIGPFLWYYIMKANRQNFCFDITCYDSELLQYTVYEKGMYYNWHPDQHLYTQFTPNLEPSSRINEAPHHAKLNAEYCRKLSFSLQLSDPSEYEGGELQFLDAGKLFTAPQERGKLIIFDSRTLHRVRKVKSGVRKSLVGWVVGPRWK